MVSNRFLKEKGLISTSFPIYRRCRKAVCIFFYASLYGHDVVIKGIPEGRKDRYIVYHPYYREWTIGFVSYDGKGLVIRHPFLGVYNYAYVYYAVYDIPHRVNSTVFDMTVNELFGTKHAEALKKAERGQYPYYVLKKSRETEEKAEQYLENALSSKYFVYLLPNSGFKRGGDIYLIPLSVTSSIDLGHYSLSLLKKSHISIEVIGVSKYYFKNRLNHKNKNFLSWVRLLNSFHTLPVIMFYVDDSPYFLICDEKTVLKLFYKKNGKPRTTYTKVDDVLPYTCTLNDVLNFRDHHKDVYY